MSRRTKNCFFFGSDRPFNEIGQMDNNRQLEWNLAARFQFENDIHFQSKSFDQLMSNLEHFCVGWDEQSRLKNSLTARTVIHAKGTNPIEYVWRLKKKMVAKYGFSIRHCFNRWRTNSPVRENIQRSLLILANVFYFRMTPHKWAAFDAFQHVTSPVDWIQFFKFCQINVLSCFW